MRGWRCAGTCPAADRSSDFGGRPRTGRGVQKEKTGEHPPVFVWLERGPPCDKRSPHPCVVKTERFSAWHPASRAYCERLRFLVPVPLCFVVSHFISTEALRGLVEILARMRFPANTPIERFQEGKSGRRIYELTWFPHATYNSECCCNERLFSLRRTQMKGTGDADRS
jgi:hypothetical protein